MRDTHVARKTLRETLVLRFNRKKIIFANLSFKLNKMEDDWVYAVAEDALNDLFNILLFEYDDWLCTLQDVFNYDEYASIPERWFKRERFVIEKFGSIEAYVKWWVEK